MRVEDFIDFVPLNTMKGRGTWLRLGGPLSDLAGVVPASFSLSVSLILPFLSHLFPGDREGNHDRRCRYLILTVKPWSIHHYEEVIFHKCHNNGGKNDLLRTQMCDKRTL